MQHQILDLASETLAENAKIMDKVFDCNVENARNMSKHLFGQAENMFNVRSFDEAVAAQSNWFEKWIGQSREAGEALYQISVEANASYGAIWNKYAAQATVLPVAEAKGG